MAVDAPGCPKFRDQLSSDREDMAALTHEVPPGTHRRLTEHYGAGIAHWLTGIDRLFADAADQWDVRLAGFHDAGWTSVVAFGYLRDDQPVVLKALPEAERFVLEKEALTHWGGDGVCRLRRVSDDDQILMLDAVGRRIGGSTRPDDHAQRVAAALPRLHQREVMTGQVPLVVDYYRDTVMPRIEQRALRFADIVGATRVGRALDLCRDLASAVTTRVMLHSDLYAENVLFDVDQTPIFIDPHAKVGSPAFDWAFWCVYYTPTEGFAERVALCREQVPDLVDEVLAWCATLAVDGCLYYLDTDDPTAMAMLDDLRDPLLSSLVGK